MYSIAAYGRMIADKVRVAAYTEALQQAITPGCTVVDIGTGTGFFAMLACQLGAGHVYAIEPDDVIDLARRHAAVNGFADRITFIKELSTRVQLPAPADIVVSDLRTVLPWFQHHIPTIVDARTRLLAPGGTLIPQQDRLWAAAVEMPFFYADHVGHQAADTAPFDMAAAREAGANGWTKVRAKPEHLLTEPRLLATVDYRHVVDEKVDAAGDWTIQRGGTLHGLAAWFDTSLLGDIGFTNAPGAEPALYGNAFFPLIDPVEVGVGDHVSLKLRASRIEDDYVWRWETSIRESGPEGVLKARFSQHNLTGFPSPGFLKSRAPRHVPVLNSRGRIDRFVLERMDGNTSLQELASLVAESFPDDFADAETALEVVGDVSARYSERD